MLKGLTHMSEDHEEGFSLVELLVVIVIIGILSAIAIAAFLNQRQKANDASVESDVRTAVTNIETMLVDHPNASLVYVETPITVEGEVTIELRKDGETLESATIQLSEGVQIYAAGNPNDSYTVWGSHKNGSKYVTSTGYSFKYESGIGKFSLEEPI